MEIDENFLKEMGNEVRLDRVSLKRFLVGGLSLAQIRLAAPV